MKYNNYLFAFFLLLIGVVAGKLLPDLNIFQQASIEETSTSCTDYTAKALYRCAMHPDFIQKQAGQCKLCGMNLSYDLNLLVPEFSQVGLNKEQAKWIGLKTRRLEKNKINQSTFEVYGKVVYDKRFAFKQVSRLPGIVEELYIKEVGEKVRKGQKIALVYSREIIAAIESLKFSTKSPSITRSAKNNLLNWNFSEAQIKQLIAQENYHKSVPIYAEAAGVVTSINVKKGDFLANAHMGHLTPLFELHKPNQFELEIAIPESAMMVMEVGKQATYTFPFSEKIYHAQIRKIMPSIKAGTSTGTIVLHPHATPLGLKEGMQVIAKIKQESDSANTFDVPKSAVLWAGEESGVYIVKGPAEHFTFEWINVKIIGESGMDYSIFSKKLHSGLDLVIEGSNRLDGIAQLKGKRSMFNTVDKAIEPSTFVIK